MKCPKCNATYKSEVKNCPKCGYLFDSSDVEKFSNLFNTDLLEVYYPNKEEEKEEREYSIYYAFLTIFYAVYKRMYRCAILSALGFMIFIRYFPQTIDIIMNSGGFYFFLILSVLAIGISPYFYYTFNFDRLLADRRKMKINSLIKNNPDKTREEIKELVKKDNEGNTKGVIITVILTIIFIIYMLFSY